MAYVEYIEAVATIADESVSHIPNSVISLKKNRNDIAWTYECCPSRVCPASKCPQMHIFKYEVQSIFTVPKVKLRLFS